MIFKAIMDWMTKQVSGKDFLKILGCVLGFLFMAGIGVAIVAVLISNNLKRSANLLGDGVVQAVINCRDSYVGWQEGHADGKEQALAEPDVQTVVKSQMAEIGRLAVLEAEVCLHGFTQIGTDYYCLEALQGEAKFTVDLEQTTIEHTGTTIQVTLPPVEMQLYFDESKTEVLAEYQKDEWTGTAKDGFTAITNTRKETFEQAREEIRNYDALMAQAEQLAKANVERLLEQVKVNDKKILVSFAEEVTAE